MVLRQDQIASSTTNFFLHSSVSSEQLPNLFKNSWYSMISISMYNIIYSKVTMYYRILFSQLLYKNQSCTYPQGSPLQPVPSPMISSPGCTFPNDLFSSLYLPQWSLLQPAPAPMISSPACICSKNLFPSLYLLQGSLPQPAHATRVFSQASICPKNLLPSLCLPRGLCLPL